MASNETDYGKKMAEVVALMAMLRGKVDALIAKKIAEIIAMCQEYAYLGKRFSFKSVPGLDEDITRLLLQLSDEVMSESMRGVDKAIELSGSTERNSIISYVNRERDGEDATTRDDKYASRLKYFVEGMMAVGFANHLNNVKMYRDIITYYKTPYVYPLISEAFKHPEGYVSEMILSRGFHLGSGTQGDVAKGFTVVGRTMIDEAYQMGTALTFKKMGYEFYRVRRGSTYDCATCDELCVGVHPVNDIVLPAHPHCCCYMIPVTENGQ